MCKTYVGTAEVKARWSEMLRRIASRRERMVVLRCGRPNAVLVTIEDLHRLEASECVDADAEAGLRHPIMVAFGGWSDRDDLAALVTGIHADRLATTGREVARRASSSTPITAWPSCAAGWMSAGTSARRSLTS